MPFGFRHSQQDADHLHRQLGGDVDQEVEWFARDHGVQQPTGPCPQVVFDQADHSRRQPRADQPPDLRVPRIVHHVEHLTGDRQILQQRSAERPVTAGDRRERDRIFQHRKRFGVGGDGPEALAVGGVLGRLMPVDRGVATVDGKKVVREAGGEVVQVGEVDLGERPGQSHRIAPGAYFAASG